MAKHEGYVNTLTTKNWTNPQGRTMVLHGFGLRGVDGFFGLGTKAPTFNKGDFVSFEANDAKKVQGDVTVGAAKQAAGGSAPSGSTYAGREDSRQDSISWQSARNAAIALVPHLMSVNALAMPKNGTPPKNFAALLAHVDGLTLKFYQDTYATGDKPKAAEVEEPGMDDDAGDDEDGE